MPDPIPASAPSGVTVSSSSVYMLVAALVLLLAGAIAGVVKMAFVMNDQTISIYKGELSEDRALVAKNIELLDRLDKRFPVGHPVGAER